MTLPIFVLMLASAAAAPEQAQALAPRVIDRIVAVIGQQPLFLSQLEFEARVALISQGGTEAASAPLGEEELGPALDYAVGQRLAFAEAERLRVFAPSEDEVRQALQQFAAHFSSDRRYRQFLMHCEMSEGQLAVVMRRDLRVARYLDSRVKLASRISEQQTRAWYNAHAAEFGDRAYGEVREAIKAQLGRERFRLLTQRHLAELRAKADVRMVAPFARSRAAAAPAPADAVGPDAGVPTPQP